MALFTVGENDEAIQVFQETIKLEPTMWRGHDNLGSALHRAGRHSEAIECFSQALRLNPSALDVYGRLAEAQAMSQQPAVAIATVEKALQLAQDLGDMATAEKIHEQLTAYRTSLAKAQLEYSNPSAENNRPTN